jgi:hypothetical protein
MSGYEDLARFVTFRPLERPVTGHQRASQFRGSWSSTVELLAKELRAHGARQAVLEIDMREQDFRIDGLPRANARASSAGVVLSFHATAVPGKPMLRYEVGTYGDWQDNVRAIAKGLEALRAVDRYGVTKRGEQYAGWKQLESGGPSGERGRELIRQHGGLKEALMATHPDHGGDPGDFADVQAARGQA